LSLHVYQNKLCRSEDEDDDDYDKIMTKDSLAGETVIPAAAA